MGFGFKLAPGIRVSTRGVRIGPRIANVRVGRGGAGVSVGPRAARVHVGTRGVGVSSGVGPASVSSWGARIGVGVGPAYLGVGTRGGRALVGAGPVWFSTGRKGRRSGGGGSRSGPTDGGSSGSGQRQTMAQERIAAAGKVEYAAYMDALRSAGVQRRNRFEIHAASVNAYLNDMATLVAWASPFKAVHRPEVPPLPPQSVHLEATKERLKANGRYRWYRPGSERVLEQEAGDALDELRSARAETEDRLRESFDLFRKVDPYMNLLVIQAVFSDNLLPAAPVDLDDTSLLVFMTFGDADRLIWPEKFDLSDSGLPAVAKLSDSEKNIRHLRVLLRCMTATAKEALASQPALSSVRVVALDEDSNEPLHLRPVYGDATFSRDLLKVVSPRRRWETPWNDLVNTWLQNGGVYDERLEQLFVAFVTGYGEQLLEAERHLYSEVLGQIAFRQEGRKDKLKSIGLLGDFFPPEVLKSLDANEMAEDGAFLTAQSPDDVSDYEFWLDAYELRKEWRAGVGVGERQYSGPGETVSGQYPIGAAEGVAHVLPFSECLDSIEDLAAMVDAGILTPDEFQQKKEQLLDESVGSRGATLSDLDHLATPGKEMRRSLVHDASSLGIPDPTETYVHDASGLGIPDLTETYVHDLDWRRTRLLMALHTLGQDSGPDEGSNPADEQALAQDEDFAAPEFEDLDEFDDFDFDF